jgi:hypothetical protein
MLSSKRAERQAWYASLDGGDTWHLTDRHHSVLASISAGLLDSLSKLDSEGLQGLTEALTLPAGAVQVDFFDQQNGWAFVMQGECLNKQAAVQSGSLLRCQVQRMLLSTHDGGRTWEAITPP